MDKNNMEVIDDENNDGADDNQDQSNEKFPDEEEKRLEELFRVLRPQCTEYLRASHLIRHLTFIEANIKEITKMERKSTVKATQMLFDLITKSTEPQKWNKFVIALETEDFLSLHKVCAVCKKDDFDLYAQLFDLLSVDFEKNRFDILDLSKEMLKQKCLTEDEFSKIESMNDEEGEVAALFEFISCQQLTVERWVNGLLSCLSEMKKNDLQELIQKKGSDMFSNENNLEILITLWKDLIINRVRVNDIWPYLNSDLGLPKPSTRDLSDKKIMENILNDITISESLGKWRSFYNALYSAGYESLCNKLDGDKTNSYDEDYLKMITICTPHIRQDISVVELLSELESKGVITLSNIEEIKQLKARKGDIAAAELLLDSIHRKKEKWFSIFLQCLVDNGQQEIAKKICPDYNDLLEKKCIEYEEEDEYSEEEDEEEKGHIQLRDYQNELLREPRNRKNCIICADTGSGKTIVALQLIKEHLDENVVEIRKVVFLTNQVTLAQQQGRLCRKYIPHHSSCVLTGNNESNSQCILSESYEENDILLLTPQILLDNLDKGNLPSKSLTLFSLMIFDECHHTNKKHPYNELMSRYIDEKLEHSDAFMCLPQIVGLTASIGVGGAKSEEFAVAHIHKICANLDCEEICTIEENQWELQQYINKPDDNIINTESLSDERFKDEISKMMIQVEKELNNPEVSKLVRRESKELFRKSTEHPNEREKNLYTNWLGDLKKMFLLLKNREARLHYYICSDFLNIYHNALIINDSCRIKDAIAYIERKLQEQSSDLPTDKLLKSYWDEKKADFLLLSQDPRYDNPLLQKLEHIVLDTVEKIPDSRILIFVKSRCVVTALNDWIKDSEKLKFLNPERLVGGAQKLDNPGMTTVQQEQRLDKFREGSCKLLVATLGEEGLDIEKCNLVLNFNDVKNEISLVQKRGRARAKNGKYITLANASSGISEREIANIAREKLMKSALKKVQQLKDEDPKNYKDMIKTLQKNQKFSQVTESNSIVKTSNKHEYDMKCIKCSEYFGSSSDVKVIQETQFTFLNEEFESKITVVNHPRPKTYDKIKKVSKIFCKKCQKDLGIKVIFNKRLLPIIKIASFQLNKSESEKPIYCKQWKTVPFKIKEIKPEQLALFPLATNVPEG